MGRQAALVVAACCLSCVVVAVPDPPNYIKLKTPDVFTVLGPLDPAYKNPCFHSRVDQKFVCLPYFNILGNDLVSQRVSFHLFHKQVVFCRHSKVGHDRLL